MREPRMAALLTGSGRPGFYLRVLDEGTVEAGDDIVRVAAGPEQLSVATINALLYVDRRPDPEMLERALRIPALSPGWRESLHALLEQQRAGAPDGGNAGLTRVVPPPAWRGFRPLLLVAKRRESAAALSLELEPVDDERLAPGLAGQFITLKLEPGNGVPALVRSYSRRHRHGATGTGSL